MKPLFLSAVILFCSHFAQANYRQWTEPYTNKAVYEPNEVALNVNCQQIGKTPYTKELMQLSVFGVAVMTQNSATGQTDSQHKTQTGSLPLLPELADSWNLEIQFNGATSVVQVVDPLTRKTLPLAEVSHATITNACQNDTTSYVMVSNVALYPGVSLKYTYPTLDCLESPNRVLGNFAFSYEKQCLVLSRGSLTYKDLEIGIKVKQ